MLVFEQTTDFVLRKIYKTVVNLSRELFLLAQIYAPNLIAAGASLQTARPSLSRYVVWVLGEGEGEGEGMKGRGKGREGTGKGG